MQGGIVFLLRRLQFPFHYIAYYVAWLLGVSMPAHQEGGWAVVVVLGITAIQLAWQVWIDKRVHGLLRMVAVFTVIGSIVDSVVMNMGLIVFRDNPWAPFCSPPWMIALWINFAVVYYAVMHILWGRYLYLGLMSALAFPLVYLAGERLGAVTFPLGDESALIYGALWLVLMPLCDYWSRKQGVCYDG